MIAGIFKNIFYELLPKRLVLVDLKGIAVEDFKELFKLVWGDHIIMMVIEFIEEPEEVS